MLQKKKSAVAIVTLPEVATVEKSLWELLRARSMTATAGPIWEHKGETDSDHPIPELPLQISLGPGRGH